MLNLRKGTTLLEIMAALLILAFAFIPLMGIIGTSSGDSDVANSVVFAQTSVRNILDTLLEDVPFHAVRPAPGTVSDMDGSNPDTNVAEIVNLPSLSFDRQTFLNLIGNTGTVDGFARGEIRDERGIVYKTKLFVFPISAGNPINYNNDMAFTYLPRPIYENQLNGAGENVWYTYPTDGTPFMRNTGDIRSPYEAPDGVKVIQPGFQRPGSIELGVAPGPADNNHCVMKKILLKITWQNRSGHERSVDIFTMKADLQ